VIDAKKAKSGCFVGLMCDRVICISCIQNHLNYIDLAMKIHNEMVKLALVELLGYNYTNLLTNRKNYEFFPYQSIVPLIMQCDIFNVEEFIHTQIKYLFV